MYTKNAAEHAETKSVYSLETNTQKPKLTITDAAVKWAHFTKSNKFNRSLTVVLSKKAARELKDYGLYVKEFEDRDGDIEYHLDIAVGDSKERYCPRIIMYSESNGKKSRTTLGFEDDYDNDIYDMAQLDRGMYERVSLAINIIDKTEPSAQYGSKKGYLQSLKCILIPMDDGLDSEYYDNYMNAGSEDYEPLPFA